MAAQAAAEESRKKATAQQGSRGSDAPPCSTGAGVTHEGCRCRLPIASPTSRAININRQSRKARIETRATMPVALDAHKPYAAVDHNFIPGVVQKCFQIPCCRIAQPGFRLERQDRSLGPAARSSIENLPLVFKLAPWRKVLLSAPRCRGTAHTATCR